MNWIVTRTKWIMLVSRMLTCSVLLAALVGDAIMIALYGAYLLAMRSRPRASE